MTTPAIAHPPATLEGWFALHQIFRIDRERVGQRKLDTMIEAAAAAVASDSAPASATKSKKQKIAPRRVQGWSAVVKVIGSTADIMVIHFRDSLDTIGVAQDQFARTALSGALIPVYAFLSVTEAGLYHITADVARDAESRGG